MPTYFIKCQYIHETSTAQKCICKLEFKIIIWFFKRIIIIKRRKRHSYTCARIFTYSKPKNTHIYECHECHTYVFIGFLVSRVNDG